MKTVKTNKGTELPLLNLRGKDYLQVAYRIQWMNEDVPHFEIETEILKMDKDESVVKAKITIFDENMKIIKRAQATKREDSKGFADHLEKAETSAIGRALAVLGYGTQFAISDLDEGTRLADSPLEAPLKVDKSSSSSPSITGGFRKPKTTTASTVSTVVLGSTDNEGWS